MFMDETECNKGIMIYKRSVDMAVTVVNHTGISEISGALTIKINGKEIRKIKKGQQVEINIPTDHARLIVTQFTKQSNELEVKDGETIEITTAKWSNLINLCIILFLPMLTYIPNFQYRDFGIIIYTIVAPFIIFGIDRYRLEKI